MSKSKIVEPVVREVLEQYEETRGDNFKLISYVYDKINPEIRNYMFNAVMLGHNELNLPPVESITRARRKLQHDNPALKPNKVVQGFREIQESEYIEYSRR